MSHRLVCLSLSLSPGCVPGKNITDHNRTSIYYCTVTTTAGSNALYKSDSVFKRHRLVCLSVCLPYKYLLLHGDHHSRV